MSFISSFKRLVSTFVAPTKAFWGFGTLGGATFLRSGTLVAVGMLLAACASGAKSGGGASDKVIVIGGDFATSGGDASAGVPTQNGAQLAIDQEAQRGLPGGYTVKSEFLDDTVGGVHDPAQGVRNVQSLLQDAKVLALVGPQNSSVARAEIPVANQADIALVSPSATSIELTDDASGAAQLRPVKSLHTFFRVVLRDDLQGAADADFAYATLRARRAYVVDDNEAYGRGLADVFAKSFSASGGVVLERAHFTAGQQDFIALLTRAQGLRPDIVYYGGVVSTGGAELRRQMVSLAMPATFMGGDGIWDPGFLTAAGAAANGAYCSKGAPDLSVLPSASRFLRDYAARFPGQPIGTYSANAYVAAEVTVEAIRSLMERNGGVPPTRAQVVAAIASSTVSSTPLGPIAFSPSGDVTTPVVSMWKVAGGKFAFLSQQTKALAP